VGYEELAFNAFVAAAILLAGFRRNEKARVRIFLDAGATNLN
jgi:hypothetical protein